VPTLSRSHRLCVPVNIIFSEYLGGGGGWGSVVVKALRYYSEGLGIDPQWIFSEATDGTMCPGVDLASKNEYQENSWG
jgi:hypothetical protein